MKYLISPDNLIEVKKLMAKRPVPKAAAPAQKAVKLDNPKPTTKV